ncbi:response regulator [Lyngbya aestuarii]|uniref:response regulator n=1 Tax=Lyngbya aestuarii TaxID=118322 RepID=UPI00403D6BEA
MRILVVEDDQLTAEVLKVVLSKQNYLVETAHDGQAALELAETFIYDLILLDVVLPKLDGISLCRKLRSQAYQVPILLLTGRDSSDDKATGLDAGADDYIVKPFDEQELMARVRALLRRGNSTSLPTLKWGKLELDPTTHQVTYGIQPLVLTPKEYSLLELFLRNNRRVFSCSAILEHLWTFEEAPGEEAVRTHVKSLRKRLKIAGAPTNLIETVYGIGYRLKPIEATTLVSVPTNNSDKISGRILSEIAVIWERYQHRISKQVAVIEQAVTALAQQQLTEELAEPAEREAHTLAGSLSTFGFAEGSRLALKIEHMFQARPSWKPRETLHLQKLATALRREIERVPDTAVAATTTQENEQPRLLIIQSDRQLSEQLATEAAHGGIRAEIATNLAAAREMIAEQSLQVVLLDPAISDNPKAGLVLLAELTRQTPPAPVLVLTAQDSLSTRLEVARLGGHTFLRKPLAAEQVMEAVTEVLQKAEETTSRVMVVDDDPKILTILRSLLEPWGMKVKTLNNPQHFWETLEDFAPDLLILDVEMPQISGIELCQVVRNDSRWNALPVIFLTIHTDATVVNQLFAVGADDFVSKPVVGTKLVSRIINRLERLKLLSRIPQTDPVSGVANRHSSTQELEKLLHLAKQHQQPVSLAIIAVQHFQELNNHYGHKFGDALLRRIGQLLLESFRSEDVIARWGGAEFILGMYGMNKRDSIQRLAEVLASLRQRKFLTSERLLEESPVSEIRHQLESDPQLRLMFNAGIAQYPGDGTSLQSLYRSADAALAKAKERGNGCIFPADTTTAEPSATNLH